MRFRPAPLPASPVAWLARPGRAQFPGVGRDQRAESRPPPSPTETGIRGPGGRNPQPHSGCPGRHWARVGQGWGAKAGTEECGNPVLPAPGLVALSASLAVVGTPLSPSRASQGPKWGPRWEEGMVGPGCLLLETQWGQPHHWGRHSPDTPPRPKVLCVGRLCPAWASRALEGRGQRWAAP